MLKHVSKPLDYALLIACALPLMALLPLLTYAGLPNTADGPIHLMRQVEFDLAWGEGTYYPRWGFNLAYGHGMPIFSYAPPALYFLTQFLHLGGLPLDTAMKMVVVGGFIAYSVGMFLFVRQLYGPYPALMAASLHLYAPYRLREAYIQGNYGQFSGLACYAFIFWAFHGLITRGWPRYRLAAPLALAMLLLSHNISAMIFAPLFAAYLIMLLLLTAYQQPWGVTARAFGWTVICGLLGLGLAAIFWLPAFGERHDIKLEGITQDFFDFRHNFLRLSELLSPPVLLDVTAINPEFPLSIGMAQLIGVLMGLMGLLLYGLWPRQHRYPLTVSLHTTFFIGGVALYGFLSIPISDVVWANVPLLELTEFPWRMLGPTLFCAAVLGGGGFFYLLERLPPRAHLPVWLGGLMVVISLNLPYLYPSQFIVWGNPTLADVFRYEVDSGAIGTTSTGEFLPRTASQHPVPETFWEDYQAGTVPPRVDSTTLPSGATVERLIHQTDREQFRVETKLPFTLTLRMLHWPGWRYYLNALPTEFTLTEGTGLVQLTIPAGEHYLTAQLENTPLRTWGAWLTLLSTLIMGGLLLDCLIRPFKMKGGETSRFVTSTPTAAVFALTLLMLPFGYGLTRPLEPLFVWHSDPNQPRPADHVLQADFGEKIRLVGRDDLPTTPLELTTQPTLEMLLYWRALQNLDQNYAIFVHLDAPNGETFATVDEPTPEFIPSSKWPPGLYLRNLLTLELPPTLPPIRYTLNVGLYDPTTGERLPLPDGQTLYPLGHVWLKGVEPPRPAVPLAYFGENIQLQAVTDHLDGVQLLWETTHPIATEYRIFVHQLDEEGGILSQTDGVPYQGLYPLSHWRPHQLIVDERPLILTSKPTDIAIGLYDPVTGQRLSATDSTGQPLPDNRYLFTR